MKLSQFTKKVEKPSIDDRIMPLINIVFLLLIFFLVAGIIREADPMDILPPESVVEDISPEDSINLYIDADAHIVLEQIATEKSDVPLRLKQRVISHWEQRHDPEIYLTHFDVGISLVE